MIPLSALEYDLPAELIADFPNPDRAGARLLAVNRAETELRHLHFRDLADCLSAGDLLVLNDTRVIPARLLGHRQSGGRVEAMLLAETSPGVWEALMKPGGRIRAGDAVFFDGGSGETLEAVVQDEPREGTGQRSLCFRDPEYRERIGRIGHMPLPPYIRREDTRSDRSDYQTIFAEREGAVAAPTAGLHFDLPLLEKLGARGVEIVKLTLHVGYGTFQPVQEEDVTQHRIHREAYEIPAETAAAVNRARSESRRVIACGTTVVRALESAAGQDGRLRAEAGETELFIYPPYRFKVVDGLITNFHFPRSTLLLLVGAFLGMDHLMRAYREAIGKKYRFFSYGDAMLIL